MSFLKITDPKKRDELVKEFLQTKRNIKQNYLSDRLGEIETQRELTTLFKPVVTSQQEATQNIIEKLRPIEEGLQAQLLTPKAQIGWPALPQVPAQAQDEEDEMIGPIAAKYLRKFASKTGEVDTTFGMYNKDGKFYIGNQQIGVLGDNLTVSDQEYEGTPGLWELLVMKRPDGNVYTDEDYNTYAKIMINTNALRKGNDRNNAVPKASRGWKWKNLMKTIWDNRDEIEGSGMPAVILPSDAGALLDRLDLLMASKDAGNTGLRNEIVSICDELKRQKIFNKDDYKKLMLQL